MVGGVILRHPREYEEGEEVLEEKEEEEKLKVRNESGSSQNMTGSVWPYQAISFFAF